MNLYSLLREGRRDLDARMVATDALLQRGYSESRIVRAFEPPVRVVVHGVQWQIAHPRRRVRALCLDTSGTKGTALHALGTDARYTQRWIYQVRDGGTVANAYSRKGYGLVVTETVVIVASPDGDVSIWFGEARANNYTQAAGARGALNDAASRYFDLRYGKHAHAVAAEYMRYLHGLDHSGDQL